MLVIAVLAMARQAVMILSAATMFVLLIRSAVITHGTVSVQIRHLLYAQVTAFHASHVIALLVRRMSPNFAVKTSMAAAT